MSLTLRAIVMIAELVVLIGFDVLYFKINKSKGYSKENLRFEMKIYHISILVFIALCIFLYPSYIFLSMSKLIFVSIIFILFILFLIIVFCLDYTKKEGIADFLILLILLDVAIVIAVTITAIKGTFNYDNKEWITNEITFETIEPTMFSENQIGYTADSEGNQKTFLFFYEKDGAWNFEEIDASEVKRERIKDKDTYIEKTITTKKFINTEKRESAKDYISEEKNEADYTLFLNLKQMVEIKKNN